MNLSPLIVVEFELFERILSLYLIILPEFVGKVFFLLPISGRNSATTSTSSRIPTQKYVYRAIGMQTRSLAIIVQRQHRESSTFGDYFHAQDTIDIHWFGYQYGLSLELFLLRSEPIGFARWHFYLRSVFHVQLYSQNLLGIIRRESQNYRTYWQLFQV